jgi:HD-GYP domain-containing protein (c-di-GMP phosphodiesterase class II)
MSAGALMERLGSTLDEELELTEHGRCVAVVSMQLAGALGFERRVQRRIGLAGALHDVGKRLIDERILDKPGPLDEGEWAQVRMHPELGERILRNAGLPDIAKWVRWHHERPDGRGYPDHLWGPHIPLEASVLAVADAYDAMVTVRCYGAPLEPEEALAELRRCAGSQFDPRVVSAALRCGLELSDGADAHVETSER